VFSNRNLALVALALIAGIVSDGWLYNQAPATQAIYPLDNPASIKISYQERVLLTLQKTETQSWVITSPFNAPANDSRVALLLDSNIQTSRSYANQDIVAKKYSVNTRGTTNDEFPYGFSDPVELQVNEQTFLLGDIEPVSQLRYVSANNRVYLQADHIVPLLKSIKSTFTDLRITGSVESVEIVYQNSNSDPELPDTDPQVIIEPITTSSDRHSRWSNLDALSVIDAQLLDQPPFALVTLRVASGDRQFEIIPMQNRVALRPREAQFAYVLSEQQVSNLGI